jgi:hypothetical protein
MTLKTPHGRDVSFPASVTTGNGHRPTLNPGANPGLGTLGKGVRLDQVTGGKHRVEGVPVQVAGRPNLLQFYELCLYNKALPLDLFPLRGHREVCSGDLVLDAWVMSGSHLLRVGYRELRACELLTPYTGGLPGGGVVTRFLCAGEHEYEHAFSREDVNYMIAIQTESLSENLYAETYQELLEHAREVRGLTHLWEDEAGRCLTMLDLQRFAREVHVHAFHMIGNGGLVLRTQTIFELMGHG